MAVVEFFHGRHEDTAAAKTRNGSVAFRWRRRFGMKHTRNYELASLFASWKLEDIERKDTLGEKAEICINYLRHDCLLGSRCKRIHPVDTSPFLEHLNKHSTTRRPGIQLCERPSGEEVCVDVTSADYIESFLADGSDTPKISLPKTKASGYHIGDPDLSNSHAVLLDAPDLLSCDSEQNQVMSSEEQSWTCQLTSNTESLSWDPETGTWGAVNAHDWISDNSSATPSSGPSTPRSRVTHLGDGMSHPSADRQDNEPEGLCQKLNPRPRPPYYPDKCRRWLRNACDRGYACPYVHDDLDYGPGEVLSRRPSWTVTVHDHIDLQIVAGFEIDHVTTGFETSYMHIHGIPKDVKAVQVLDLLKSYGNIQDIRMSDTGKAGTANARIHFSKPEEAQMALSRLKDVTAFGSTLSVQLAIATTKHRNVAFKDGTVVIEWAPPGKTWYAGYKDMTDAQRSIAQACTISSGNPIDAQIHTGLPAAGPVTVRFRGFPDHFSERDFEELGNPSSVLFERPRYTDLSRVTQIMKSRLEEFGKLLSFHVDHPTHRSYKIKAYAHFASTTSADEACKRLHGLSPAFTGKTKIFAHHHKCLEYRLSPEAFANVSSDIETLREDVWHRFRHDASVTVSSKHLPVIVELRAKALRLLGRLKLEFEKIISGDVVKNDGKVVWDDYLKSPPGIQYIKSLQAHHIGINIHIEFLTHKIRLFGSSHTRETVAKIIIRKVLELRAQRVSFIPLDGRFIGVFMSKELLGLQQYLGPENVVLDTLNCRLQIRGDDLVYRRASEFVRDVYSRYSKRQHSSDDSCPICLHKPNDSIRLWVCGHSWCRACLTSYLLAATSNGIFPLGCLGAEARCVRKIPLVVARDLLSVKEFQSLTEASFSAYVRSHSDEFRYCPSPDCPQVYRTASKGLVNAAMQCPSCLIRICTACHQEAHDGFSCVDNEDWDEEMQEWAKGHDVKRCPGCHITIERIEGCNHMTCANCKTHICWVCLKTFPEGAGIYGHMRTEHGSFGLGPII